VSQCSGFLAGDWEVEMETEAPKAQALTHHNAKAKRVKVQIYASAGVYTGYIDVPLQRRLLDVLNGFHLGELCVSEEFLPVSETRINSLDRSEVTVQNLYLNKANILFVKEIGGEETRGLGGEAGHKPYPFVSKTSIGVELYVASYTLTGQVYCAKGQSISDVLKSETRFIPLTNVGIYPSAGSSESGVSFIAVNKGQIISMQELEVSVQG